MAQAYAHLQPDFDPTKAKVAELRGILLQHDVPYISVAKKVDLIKAYETSIRPRAKVLLAGLRVRPSADGILDGESQDGSLLDELKTSDEDKPPARSKARAGAGRKSMTTSRKGKGKQEAVSDVDEAEEEPEPAPRARGRKSIKVASKEESSEVDEDDPAPVLPSKRRISNDGAEETKRRKEGSSPKEKDRRQSLKYESGAESGFSDFNPFQSGGEDSPNPKTKRRKSSIGPARSEPASARKAAGRKSLPNPSTSRLDSDDGLPPPLENDQDMFHSDLSSPAGAYVSPGVKYMVPPRQLQQTPPASAPRAPPHSEDYSMRASTSQRKAQVAVTSDRRASLGTPRTSLKMAPPPSDRIVTPRRSIPVSTVAKRVALTTPAPRTSHVKISLGSLLGLLFLYALWWREEKLATGFCDTGSATNAIVSTRSGSRVLQAWLPPLPPAVSTLLDAAHLLPSCTICPAHGQCSGGEFLSCAADYVARPHPFSFGGILPLAPSCSPDTEKLMAVATLASRAARILRLRRGEVVCSGKVKASHLERRGEAVVYGLSREALMAMLRDQQEVFAPSSTPEMVEDVARLALSDLKSHDEVFTGLGDSEVWYASKTADMPLSCRIRRAALQSALKHKAPLAGLFSLLAAVLYIRDRRVRNQQEEKQVRQLVQTALQQLRDQDRLHQSDPVLAPSPHVAPSHLRDLVLQLEHSPARRQLLWKKVEKVVEGNSNVRAKQVELNGEEIRAWEWSGQGGPHSGWDSPVPRPSTGLYPSLPGTS